LLKKPNLNACFLRKLQNRERKSSELRNRGNWANPEAIRTRMRVGGNLRSEEI